MLTAIKKHFRENSKTSERHGDGSLLDEPVNVSTLKEEEEGTTDRAFAETPVTREDGTASGYHEEPRPSSVPEGVGLSASWATDRSLPGLPDEADGDYTLVGNFGFSPATYPASTAADDYLRIHVHPGCLRQEQAAGPITIKRDGRYLVECEGCSFLVSAVVDCQPSGSKFDAPLIFDFRVGETALKRDEVKDDTTTDGETGDDLDDEQRTQYMEKLKTAYKVTFSLACLPV